jgi:hypothetical protein
MVAVGVESAEEQAESSSKPASRAQPNSKTSKLILLLVNILPSNLI